MRVWTLTLLAAVLCTAANADGGAGSGGPKIYAQALVDRTIAQHPELAVLALHVTPPKSDQNQIIASNIGRIGKPADPDDLRVITSGKPNRAVNATGDHYEVELPLQDANRRPIGAVGIVFHYRAGASKAALDQQAVKIRDALARRISHVANLLEPESYDPAIPADSYGQWLVDSLLARHPRIIILALHVPTASNPDYPIVASNIGRLGKPADDDDMHVITSGESKVEFNESGDRYEVEHPLRDVSGATIGAVGVVFPYRKGADLKALRREADQVQQDLQRHISNQANLLQPFPFAPDVPIRGAAQRLVERCLAKHRDLLIVGLHVTPPGSPTNILIASNIGRIGKPADEDDLRVIETGQPNLEVNENGTRFEVETRLFDAAHHPIGAVGLVFPYKAGDDQARLRAKGLAISDELARQIPNLASLVQASP